MVKHLLDLAYWVPPAELGSLVHPFPRKCKQSTQPPPGVLLFQKTLPSSHHQYWFTLGALVAFFWLLPVLITVTTAALLQRVDTVFLCVDQPGFFCC